MLYISQALCLRQFVCFLRGRIDKWASLSKDISGLKSSNTAASKDLVTYGKSQKIYWISLAESSVLNCTPVTSCGC